MPLSKELLSLKDRFNELVMTGLRTSSGVSTQKIRKQIGEKFVAYLVAIFLLPGGSILCLIALYYRIIKNDW